MSALRGGRLFTSLLFLVAALFLVHHAPTAHAELSACPGLAVTLDAGATKGRKLDLSVKVHNTGASALQDVSLRVTVPLSAVYNKITVTAKSDDDAGHNPIFLDPQVYWLSFPLKAGKARTFRLQGKISKCQEPGLFNLDAVAYQLGHNCSTHATKRNNVRMWIGKGEGRSCLAGDGCRPTLMPDGRLPFIHVPFATPT